MEIRRLDPASEAQWDAFVFAHPDATFFHRAAWSRVIELAFRRKCHFLYALADGEVQGVLPLVHVKSLLFGNALISTGFYVYGGPLAVSADAHAALDEAAWDLARELGARSLEYRNRTRLRPDWPCKADQYATFKRPIDADPEVNMKAIPRKQRAMVRKGIKFELQAEIERTPERFFALYSQSVRNLGSPVFPRRLYGALLAEFGEDCDVLTVTHEGSAVASVLSFYFRDEVLPYYGGGGADARRLAAHDFMYWSLMEHARARGCTTFDFGRSKVGTGSHSFKKNWGFDPTPLFYEFRLAPGAEMPDINPLNPKYRMMVAVWRRLPLAVANWLGPKISRNLG